MSFTLVAFHAHPDDEALLTGGTIAKAAAAGHRVVLVTATAGEAGLAADGSASGDLGRLRRAELEKSARALGCARTIVLGYPDSGSRQIGHAGTHTAFAALNPRVPAERLASILAEESADVLTIYDEHGGYGHPDHVQVHRVGVLAAAIARTPVVLEASANRDALTRIARVLSRIPRTSSLVPADGFSTAYLPRAELTHRIDVRNQLAQKRSALAAHVSQSGGGDSTRTIRLLLRLPPTLFRAALGREWFRERGRPASARPLDDVFASLR